MGLKRVETLFSEMASCVPPIDAFVKVSVENIGANQYHASFKFMNGIDGVIWSADSYQASFSDAIRKLHSIWKQDVKDVRTYLNNEYSKGNNHDS